MLVESHNEIISILNVKTLNQISYSVLAEVVEIIVHSVFSVKIP